MFFLTLIIAAVTLLSILYKFFTLRPQDTSLTKQLLFPSNKPIVIAHRAGKFEAPENTLVAIETAYKNGATAVEVDVNFSRDGVPCIFHDNDLARVTEWNWKVLRSDIRRFTEVKRSC